MDYTVVFAGNGGSHPYADRMRKLLQENMGDSVIVMEEYIPFPEKEDAKGISGQNNTEYPDSPGIERKIYGG